MAAHKKVLIITYYWPPAGGITVLRCLKIAKYLRNYGWEPIIYTAANAHYPTIDHTIGGDLPDDITVIKQPIWEPYTWYKQLTGQAKDANVNNVFYVTDKKMGWTHRFAVWVRSNFFIPDARAAWIRPSVRYLLKYLEENPVDAIFSDGPPHTNTRIATLISEKTGLPWLADFQDPWTQVDYYKLLSLTSWGNRRHHRMEQAAFREAAALTIVSPSWKKEIEAIGAKNVHVIQWGFDPDDYAPPAAITTSEFSFTHIGILGYDRNPATFFKVLAEQRTKDAELNNALAFRFVGQVDFSVKETYTAAGLEDMVHTPGSVPRNEALRIAQNSTVLLLLLNQQSNAQGRIPGKLFEYLALKRPILALGPPDSDVAKILAETQSGICVSYDDEQGIRQAINSLWEQHMEGTLAQPVASQISNYSISNLTGKIAGILDDITSMQ